MSHQSLPCPTCHARLRELVDPLTGAVALRCPCCGTTERVVLREAPPLRPAHERPRLEIPCDGPRCAWPGCPFVVAGGDGRARACSDYCRRHCVEAAETAGHVCDRSRWRAYNRARVAKRQEAA